MERKIVDGGISPKVIRICPAKETLSNCRDLLKSSSFARPPKQKNVEFVKYQRTVLNNLAYFAGTTSRILKYDSSDSSTIEYYLANNTMFGSLLYWAHHINHVIKAVFLAFLMTGYFGYVIFFDKIAATDYVLCFWLAVIAIVIWLKRYPFYETIQAGFKVFNSIYAKLGYPEKCLEKMNKSQKGIVVTYFLIIWVGCTCLMSNYVADPKYCAFTYSAFEWDDIFLQTIFGVHEFMFMELAWNADAISQACCCFQGITLSAILDEMSIVLQNLYSNEAPCERKRKSAIGERVINPKKVAIGTEYDIEKLILDYKKLIILCDQFNDWMAYGVLILQICGGLQFVSSVFSGMHILRKPGAGFLDVYFYIQDSVTGGFILTRTYRFMSLASKASKHFLKTLEQYLKFKNPKRLELRKIAKSLRVISLNVGPCRVCPLSTLTILNTLSNYWVCAALW